MTRSLKMADKPRDAGEGEGNGRDDDWMIVAARAAADQEGDPTAEGVMARLPRRDATGRPIWGQRALAVLLVECPHLVEAGVLTMGDEFVNVNEPWFWPLAEAAFVAASCPDEFGFGRGGCNIRRIDGRWVGGSYAAHTKYDEVGAHRGPTPR